MTIDLYNENYATFKKIAKERVGATAKDFYKKNKARFTKVRDVALVEVRRVAELAGRNVLGQLFIAAASGLKSVGSVARMVSALSSTLEILMFVILKDVAQFTIPNQIFNLLQIVLYFAH